MEGSSFSVADVSETDDFSPDSESPPSAAVSVGEEVFVCSAVELAGVIDVSVLSVVSGLELSEEPVLLFPDSAFQVSSSDPCEAGSVTDFVESLFSVREVVFSLLFPAPSVRDASCPFPLSSIFGNSFDSGVITASVIVSVIVIPSGSNGSGLFIKWVN